MTNFPSRGALKMLSVAGVFFGTISFAFADDMESHFQKIATGLTRDGTIAIMGREPDSSMTTNMVGFTYEKLRWIDGNRSYVVRLVGSRYIDRRVINVKSCVGTTDC